MAKQLSSRRAQIEEQKARRNLLISLFATISLGLIFLIFLMPLLFRVVVQIAQRGRVDSIVGDTIPPQRPAFQPPEEFVKSKEFSLNGYTEGKARVELVVDGQVVSTTEAGEDGSFSISAELEEKEHDILVTATDEAGNLSQTENFPVTVDTTSPTLEIESPNNDATFFLRSEQVVSIRGRLSEKGEVRVNASRTTTNAEGEFTARLSLAEGENTITLIGIDKAGNESHKSELKLYYRP